MIVAHRQTVKLTLASSGGFGEHVRAWILGNRRPDPMAWVVRLTLALLALPCCGAPAWAHAAERGFVLLLPTEYYIVGGTLAVAASFFVLLIVPDNLIRRIGSWRIELGPVPRVPEVVTSAVMFALLILLLMAGLIGSRDPLDNPLPLTVWTLWWIGMTIRPCAVRRPLGASSIPGSRPTG